MCDKMKAIRSFYQLVHVVLSVIMLQCLLLILACTANHALTSHVMIVDVVKFTRPSDFDVLLHDIQESDLHLIAQMEGASYLNRSSDTAPGFPVEGMIMGGCKRLMVNLLVRMRKSEFYTNVVFMVDTGSPYTFLSFAAIDALMGRQGNVPAALKLDIHGAHSMVCYMSPRDKHFSDVNLLGTDFLEMNTMQIFMDWKLKTFLLYAVGENETSVVW